MLKKILYALAAVLLTSCVEPDPVQEEDRLELDRNVLEFAASGTGEQLVNVSANCSWEVFCAASWLNITPDRGEGDGAVSITASDNVGKDAHSRSAKIFFKFGGDRAELEVKQYSQMTIPGIESADDFLAFAKAVNEGTSLEAFINDEGVVVLRNDIDLQGREIVPVGNPESVSNANSAASYAGAAFKGVFDGQNHCISNISVDVDLAEGRTFGLFGVLDGAEVRNLVLGKEGDASLFKVAARGQADAGVLAGSAYNGAKIENCVNNVPLEIAGSSIDAKRLAVGAFAGYICSGDDAVSIANCVNNASIKVDAGSNTANGATCVMAGGIAGFSTGSGTAVTMVESCENKGDIEARCGRSSGIVATMNAKTMMRYCLNRGSQVNTFANGRIGNLSCIMGSGCSMDDCTNYGNITTSDPATTTAGMVALLNSDNVALSGGGNYGTVIGANEKYHGLLVANFSKFASVTGCFVGGACGTYSADGNHVMHGLDADSWIKHIGSYSDANYLKITGLSSTWGSGGAVEGQLPELKDASLRILFIGNSFTKDAVEHLPGIINAAGIKEVTLAHCYYGGRTIPEYYADREVANNTFYYMNPGESKWTTSAQKVSIKSVAQSGRWDIVTIQEHTGNYRAWSWTAEEKDAISNLVGYVTATQSVKPKVYYVLSQAYFNMDKIGSGSKPSITWTDQAGMYEVIVAQAKKVMAESPVDDLLATGTMLQNLRTSKLDNMMNLTRDGYHMDYGISRYGASCLLFEKLLTPKFGIKLDGNSYRYSNSSQTDGSYSTPVTDANAPVALQAARYAIEKPYEVTDMSEGGGDEPDRELSGSGSESDPYLIADALDMPLMATSLVEGETRYFKLVKDIDMSGISHWTPVNTANKKMDIDFDGGGHKISGFTCYNTNYASLFGLVSGRIHDLYIDGASVSHSSQCGVLAVWLGNNGASATVLSAEIENVHISNSTLKMTGTGNYCAGMISANAGSSVVRNCSVSGAVITHACTKGSWSYVGGIVGRNYVACSYDKCSFEGEITGSGSNGFSGITAGSSKDVPVQVTNCWSKGSISGASYSGGIVADLCAGSTVSNCYSAMSLSGVYNLGGIVARASDAQNPNNSQSTCDFNSNLEITVSSCIAWNPSIHSTASATETPASHYSSGAVVGFTTYINTLKDCYRRPDMDFLVYSIEAYNTLTDTPDTSAESPLVKPGEETYLCPYNGTAAGQGVSALAKILGWDESVWDLSGDYPTLK